MSKRGYILDASALLAALRHESGAEHVRAVFPRARIGAVNLSEVIAKLQEFGVSDEHIDTVLGGLKLDVRPFDSKLAYRAGKLRAETRAYGLSFGDRACLALAAIEDFTAVTMDRSWAKLDLGIEIYVVPRT